VYGVEVAGTYEVWLESTGQDTTTNKNHVINVVAYTPDNTKTATVVVSATQASASNAVSVSANKTLSVKNLGVGGDNGGTAGYTTLTNGSNTAANSTGTGTIKMKGATNRNSAGFVKIYIGTTAYWVPVFSAITG
jgi:hypothetical protein